MHREPISVEMRAAVAAAVEEIAPRVVQDATVPDQTEKYLRLATAAAMKLVATQDRLPVSQLASLSAVLCTECHRRIPLSIEENTIRFRRTLTARLLQIIEVW